MTAVAPPAVGPRACLSILRGGDGCVVLAANRGNEGIAGVLDSKIKEQKDDRLVVVVRQRKTNSAVFRSNSAPNATVNHSRRLRRRGSEGMVNQVQQTTALLPSKSLGCQHHIVAALENISIARLDVFGG
jgi:hypothetical protein